MKELRLLQEVIAPYSPGTVWRQSGLINWEETTASMGTALYRDANETLTINDNEMSSFSDELITPTTQTVRVEQNCTVVIFNHLV